MLQGLDEESQHKLAKAQGQAMGFQHWLGGTPTRRKAPQHWGGYYGCYEKQEQPAQKPGGCFAVMLDCPDSQQRVLRGAGNPHNPPHTAREALVAPAAVHLWHFQWRRTCAAAATAILLPGAPSRLLRNTVFGLLLAAGRTAAGPAKAIQQERGACSPYTAAGLGQQDMFLSCLPAGQLQTRHR